MILLLVWLQFLSTANAATLAPPSLIRRQDVTTRTDTETDSGSGLATATTTATDEVLPTGYSSVSGNPAPTTSAGADPLLAIMPDFVFSMPAQVIVDGVNLSLATVLAVQLIFTAQYHHPLSSRNYKLQLISVLCVLISVAVHLQVLLSKLKNQSHIWPYMFVYLGVQIPPPDSSWTKVQEVFYLLLRATATALVHLTHIQFLTLLFPSALEARLILWMLGPLALAASAMEFTNLSAESDVKTSDLGDAIRNICSSALFLLYTSALLIWGVLVNRRRAWRTDGGTAAFGAGSVGLALLNTSISFAEIALDRLWWLPDICWTLTVWQSWLGFWWWVGSGMGIGEVEDRAERQERKRKKEEKLRRKRVREEKQRQKALLNSSGGGSSSTSNAAMAAASSRLSNNSDAILGGMRRMRNMITRDSSAEGITRRSKSSRAVGAEGRENDNNAIEMDNLQQGQEAPLTSIAVHDRATEAEDEAHTEAASSSDSQPTTSVAANSVSTGWLSVIANRAARWQPAFIKSRMKHLREAHDVAARRAATQQTALRDQVLNRQTFSQPPGLRSMRSEGREGGSISPPHQVSLQPSDTMDSSTPSSSTSQACRSLPVLERVSPGEEDFSATRRQASRSEIASPSSHAPQNEDEEWVDDHLEETENDDRLSSSRDRQQPGLRTDASTGTMHDGSEAVTPRAPSWTWRNGLRTLRMRDHTTYD